MRFEAVARNYDRLTPFERFRLTMAAEARGDDLEATRLLAAGESFWCKVKDTFGHLLGTQGALTVGWLRELESAVAFAQVLRAFDDEDADGPGDGRLAKVVRLFAYMVVMYHEANQSFLAESGMTPMPADPKFVPDQLFAGLLAEANEMAATETEALSMVREHFGTDAQLRTLDTVLADMRSMRDERAAAWRVETTPNQRIA